MAVGDGALGFWAALRKVYPATREQRCWLHKTANVLNKLPRSMQGKAKQALSDIYLRQAAEKALDRFGLYEKKFPKAVDCWLSLGVMRIRSASDCGSDERRVAAAGKLR